MDNPSELVVANRRFISAVETTFEQDMYIMDHVKASDIENIPERVSRKQLAEIAENVVLKAYRSGRLFYIVAGIMVEVGKEWTKESAEENARFFAQLKSQEDKTALQGVLVATILGFFTNADGSLLISPRFSGSRKGSRSLEKDTEEAETLATST